VFRQKLGATPAQLAALKRPNGSLLVAHRPADGDGKTFLLLSRNELKSPFVSVGGFFLTIEDVTFSAMAGAHSDRCKRFSAMQDMAAVMSQELKNPLGSLELLASLLQRDLAADPDYQRMTSQMLNAVRTMSHLLDNYLTFARQPAPARQAVALGSLVAAVLEKLQLLGRERQVVFDCQLGHQPDRFQGDGELLGQMLLNLGLNAVESSAAGGTVHLATRTLPADRQHPSLLEIRCSDAGAGINPADLERIFDPFFSTKGANRGLGLAIVHQVAEAHGGFVRVDSAPGRGATFTVLLPYSQGEPAPLILSQDTKDHA